MNVSIRTLDICEHRVRALFWSNPLGFAVINAFAFIKVREYSKSKKSLWDFFIMKIKLKYVRILI